MPALPDTTSDCQESSQSGESSTLEQLQMEVSRLRRVAHSLHDALSLATDRLEQAGLNHHDLLAPLKEGAEVLGNEPSPKVAAITIGPFVYGTPTRTEPFPPSLRFVFDCGTNRLAKLQFGDGSHAWQDASPAEHDRFLAWLLEDNEDMIDHPENWGLQHSENLEEWACEA